MLVSQVMRTSIATVVPATDLVEATRLLLETNQRALPVLDDKKTLVGIVSEGDFLRRAELGMSYIDRPRYDVIFGPGESAAHFVQLYGKRVEQIMTPKPISIDAEQTIDDVIDLMEAHDISQVPVKCAGILVGLVTRFELVAAVERVASLERGRRCERQPEAEEILQSLKQHSWLHGAEIEVWLDGRNAEIAGTVCDVRQRDAILALVQGWPGVEAVSDDIRF